MKLSKFYESVYVPTYLSRASARTIAEYRTSVHYLTAFYGDREINKYSEQIKMFATKLSDTGLSETTIEKHCRQLNTILHKIGMQYRFQSPVVLTDDPKEIFDADVRSLYAAFNDTVDFPKSLPTDMRCVYWHCVIEFVLETAVRRNVILNAEWRDIKHVDDGYLLHVRPELDKKKRSRNKPISALLVAKLNAIRTAASNIFPWSHGDKKWYAVWNETNKKASTNIHLHDLKRYSGILALRAGASEMEMIQHMDHKNIATTLRHYVKAPTRHLVDAMAMPFKRAAELPPPSSPSPIAPASPAPYLKLYVG